MQTFIPIVIGVIALIVMYVVVSNVRFLHTLVLIAQTAPYEQSGDGAGQILIIGDSTGYGTGVRDSRLSVAGRLGADFPAYSIENRSHNGDTIAEATKRIDALYGRYSLILLQLGGNDLLQKRDVPAVEADIAELYERVKGLSGHIIMMSAGNVGAALAFSGEEAEDYTARSVEFHSFMEEFAAERDDFTYVNLFADPATDPFVAEPEVYHARDGLHPSEAGYGLWYEKLRPVASEALKPSVRQ